MGHEARYGAVPGNEQLSRRERQIVRWVAAGYSNSQIANALCISPGTVHNHLDHIYKKLGLHGRVQLVLWYTRQSTGEEPCENVPDGT